MILLPTGQKVIITVSRPISVPVIITFFVLSSTILALPRALTPLASPTSVSLFFRGWFVLNQYQEHYRLSIMLTEFPGPPRPLLSPACQADPDRANTLSISMGLHLYV